MSIISNLENMLDSGEDNALVRFGLGSALFNEKKYTDAIPHLRACLEHDKDYTAAYKLLGKSLYKTGDAAAALAVFNTGLPLAQAQGDKQTEREIEVFLKKLTAK